MRRDIGLQPIGRAPVIAVRTAASPEPRMSLTLSAIYTAPSIYLHIEGEAKRRVLEAAIDDPRSRLPVRALVAQAPKAIKLFWCPEAQTEAAPNEASLTAPSPARAARLAWGPTAHASTATLKQGRE